MSDNENLALFAQANRRVPGVKTGAVKPAAAVPKNADKTGGRHAAITNNLNNWHSYKIWVETVRRTWQEKK
jgi:hypothetical protein